MTPTPVFVPAAATIRDSQLTAFMQFCCLQTGVAFAGHADFEAYCAREFRTFWELFVRWSGLLLDGSLQPVCQGDDVETAVFFPRVRLNYAENLLRVDSAEHGRQPALRSLSDVTDPVLLTRQQLLDRVVRAAEGLSRLGVTAGTRVVAVARNDAATVVATLACLRLGAIVATAAPDMGAFAILSRFRQLEPHLLLAHAGPLGDRLREVVDGLPSLTGVVLLDDGGTSGSAAPVHTLTGLERAATPPTRVEWQRFPFDHPLFVMFSSGTTGPPKCIVHGAGGTLVEHLKEHRLHLDLRAGERLFFQTSVAWMMWQWQLSALAGSVELVLHSAPPTGPDALWEVAGRHGVDVLGTSPPYLQMSERSGSSPRRRVDLGRLRAVLSTGSVLRDGQYHWLREHVGELPVMSISGGTDILGCFVLGNPNLPVHAGQAQSRSLGLDVRAQRGTGEAAVGEVGELVCRGPFPSRPLGLLDDPDGRRFHDAYFAAHPGMWTHGDLLELTAEGGARIHGRSDAVLNVRGMRIGPAELYRMLEDVPEIAESMAVEQRSPDGDDARLVLLLVMTEPGGLTADLVGHLRRLLVARGSPAHVPDLMVEVGELPTTHSGKRSEHAAREALAGRPVVNVSALRNPGALDVLRWQVRLEDARAVRPAAAGGTADPLEEMVAAAWRRVLRLPRVATDDDFFELGGTSLHVMQVFEDLHGQCGVTLPLSTMYGARTPAALAEVLRVGSWQGAPLAVPLRPGQGRPLYLLHDLTGDVLYQRPLVLALDTARPVYGLRARELDGQGAPLTSVEAMAAAYVDHVRVVQPQGPYTLAGYSFGGLVALEMARRLRHEGETVDYLAVIDSYLQPTRRARRVVRRVRRSAALAVPVLRSPRTRVPRMLRRFAAARAPWLPVAPRPGDVLLPPGLASCAGANAAYLPPPFSGDLTFFTATQRRPGYPRTDRDWAGTVTGRLSCRDVPGDHYTLMLPPHVATLARRLSEDLRGLEGAAAP